MKEQGRRMIVPVILAGGSGSRLWPLSRSAYPKQLLPLVSQRTMLQDTVLRTQNIANITLPIVVCSQEHRFLVAEQLLEIGVQNATIILEPEGRNTAPAAAIAALYERAKNSILLILPADHLVRDVAKFAYVVEQSVKYAEQNKLVTFGIKPTRPETGYGYIKVVNDNHVEQFVEKPDLKTAKDYLDSGLYYWNSGMFMFQAETYLKELSVHAPNILAACQQAIQQATQDLDFIRLDKNSFAACPNDSIDYAVMEKTHDAVLLPLESGWSDVGCWTSLSDTQVADAEGNVLHGDVVTEAVNNSYLRAESRMLAVVGVKDHIVIETSDAVLVAHKDSSQSIKNIVSRLKEIKRPETDLHRKVYRPWGYYESLHQSENFQVKRITIKPQASLSLQLHHHRSEHWVVVRGTAEVTRNEEIFLIRENESTYIPVGIKHRLANRYTSDLEIIEIQLGTYLGEDDIVRFEDNYGRI